MKVILVALALFAVVHAFPSEQDNYPSNSDTNVHQDWESKLKPFFNKAKDYPGNKSENQDKEGPHGQNEHDKPKSSEDNDKEDSHGKDDLESKLKHAFSELKDYLSKKFENKDKEGPHGQDEHDKPKSSEEKDKEDSHDKDENNKGKDDWESKLKHAFNEVKNYFSSSHDGKHDNSKSNDEHGNQKQY